MTTNPLNQLSLKNPLHLLALGFGSGLVRPAPGTWGSLLALFLGAGILVLLGIKIFLVFTAFCFVCGCYICQKTAADMGVHDHGSIVWDEFVGIFLLLPVLPELNWQWCLLGFVLFRFFDILKPFPIAYFDNKLKTGFGIMLDDLLASIYAIIVLVILQLWI